MIAPYKLACGYMHGPWLRTDQGPGCTPSQRKSPDIRPAKWGDPANDAGAIR